VTEGLQLPVGRVPGDWKVLSLKDVTSKIGSGSTPRGGASVYVKEGASFIRSQNVLDHGFSSDGLVRINEEAAYSLRGVEVRKGDVLINITGDSILRTCIVPDEVLPAHVSQHVAILRSNGLIEPQVLQKWLSLEVMKDFMLGHSSGGTRKAVTKGDLERFPVPVPPLAEQRAIASVLGAIDDKIESNHRIQNLLELESQVLYERYFEHDPESPSCVEVKLAELADINPPRQLKRGSVAKYVEMSSLPTRSALIEHWEEREVGSGQKFRNGDTLVARITPCLENGKGAFVNFLDANEVAWGSTEYIVLRPREPLPLPWAYCLSRTTRFRDFAIQHMNGSSGRQRCDAGALKEYIVRLAPEGSTNYFTEYVTKNFERMGFARNENHVLEKLRDALLPELLSGRLRVKDVESMVECVG
jgi:type I restriction enzyme S subunit